MLMQNLNKTKRTNKSAQFGQFEGGKGYFSRGFPFCWHCSLHGRNSACLDSVWEDNVIINKNIITESSWLGTVMALDLCCRHVSKKSIGELVSNFLFIFWVDNVVKLSDIFTFSGSQVGYLLMWHVSTAPQRGSNSLGQHKDLKMPIFSH